MLHPRTRLAMLHAAAHYFARIGALAVTLVTIPVAYQYLGVERFGVWMTISSLAGLLAFADLGLGNGLINLVTAANARGDERGLREVVSAAYACIGAVTLALSLSAVAVYLLGAPDVLFGLVSLADRAEAAAALAIFAFWFLLNIPASLVSKIQFGLQRGYVSGVWQTAGCVLTIIAVPVAVFNKANLATLVACLYAPQVVCNLANSAAWFYGHPAQRPSLAAASWEHAGRIVKTGMLFFVLQSAVAFAYQSDSVLIANRLGPAAVAEYAVVQRVFSFVSITASIAIAGLWPAYGDALERRDTAWVAKIFRRSFVLAGVPAAAASLFAWWNFQWIAEHWLHRSIAVGDSLVLAFAVWTVIDVLANSAAMLLNSAGVFGFQVIVASSMAMLAFGAKIVLIPLFGPAGAVMATILAYLLVSATAQVWFFRNYFSTLKRE